MVMNFDLQLFCENLKATKPPYECPVNGCGKIYRSYAGIQSHLHNYDHDSPDSLLSSSPERPASSRHVGSNPRTMRSCDSRNDESALWVEVELSGCAYKINIHEPLSLVNSETSDRVVTDSVDNICSSSSKNSQGVHKVDGAGALSQGAKLPEAHFRVLDDYVQPTDVPPKPSNYYRFIEKTREELDDEVEYDLDEEDFVWLELMNDRRAEESLPPVSKTVLELLLDRFEKRCYFEVKTSKHLPRDEDAICSICLDGECHVNNVILFCDLCNLAVHQECYGVPHIPEASWICRRCLLSPSKSVECCLCPNRRGAFKQTEDGRWAHVICALWIPEVGFANGVFLEPIDGLRRVAAARWKLVCFICKQRGIGACIQCHKTSCYTAFHVTCAQHAGLYMKTDPIRDVGISGTTLSIRKSAFCDVHSPLQNESTSACSSDENNDSSSSLFPAEARAKSRLRLRKARKALAESRNSSPILAVPVISPESGIEFHRTDLPQEKAGPPRVGGISGHYMMEEFIRRLCSYWSLKRQSKNGVPLLHTSMSSVSILRDRGGKQTVQTVSTGSPNNRSKLANTEFSHVNLKEQFHYCKKLRQQLEKVRLLNELIRKRERLKQEHLKVHQQVLQLQLAPFVSLLLQTLDQVQVKLQELSEKNCAENCLDLTDVRCKLNLHGYATVDEMASDVNSMLSSLPNLDGKSIQLGSCSHLIVQVTDILKTASQISLKVGFDSKTGLHASNICDEVSNESLSVSDRFTEDGHVKEDVNTNSTLNGAVSLELVQVNDRFTLHDKKELDLPVAYPAGINRRSAVLHSKKANRSAVRHVGATRLSSEKSVCELPTSKILYNKVDGVVNSDLFTNQDRVNAGGDGVTENEPTCVASVGALGLRNKDNFESFMKVESITQDVESRESCITKGNCDLGKNEVKTEKHFERKGQKRRRSESEVLSNTNSCDQGESGENQRHYITRGKKLQSQMSSEAEDVVIPLEPLDLVWAKCSGFPWYPALIIDPKISKHLAFHNAIPLPVPPSGVLSLRRKYSQPVFLVSFFDPRRTWQWLPRDKLDPLGVDSGLDSAKLSENKRPSMRHAVRIAYQKAINHRCLVTGEPLPSQSGAA